MSDLLSTDESEGFGGPPSPTGSGVVEAAFVNEFGAPYRSSTAEFKGPNFLEQGMRHLAAGKVEIVSVGQLVDGIKDELGTRGRRYLLTLAPADLDALFQQFQAMKLHVRPGRPPTSHLDKNIAARSDGESIEGSSSSVVPAGHGSEQRHDSVSQALRPGFSGRHFKIALIPKSKTDSTRSIIKSARLNRRFPQSIVDRKTAALIYACDLADIPKRVVLRWREYRDGSEIGPVRKLLCQVRDCKSTNVILGKDSNFHQIGDEQDPLSATAIRFVHQSVGEFLLSDTPRWSPSNTMPKAGDDVPGDEEDDAEYAESTFSSGSTGSTNATSVSEAEPAQIVSATSALCDLILLDKELEPLFERAVKDPRIGLDRLVRNFKRLLGRYSQSLMLAAGENRLHKETAKFVRTHRNEVCVSLRRHYDEEAEQLQRTSNLVTEKEMRDKMLSRFLDSLPPMQAQDFATDEPVVDEYELREEANEDTISSALDDVKLFLSSGNSLENLRKSLRDFVGPEAKPEGSAEYTSVFPQPQVLVEQASWSPSSHLTFQYICLRLVQRVSAIMGKAYNLILEPAVPEGKSRVRWTCRCGQRLFDDFTELRSGALQGLERELQEFDSANRNGSGARQAWQAIEDACKTVKDACITIFISKKRSDPVLPMSENVRPQTQPTLTTNVVNADEQSNVPQADPQLLLCIDKWRGGTPLIQQAINITTDRKLFEILATNYSMKWNVKSYISLRNVERVMLSRFIVDYSSLTDVQRHLEFCTPPTACICLPTMDRIGDEYQCTPEPRSPPAIMPAIGENRLTHYFKSPKCVNEKQTTILAQLPKRVQGELRACADKDETGWGLYIQEGWQLRRVYLLLVLLTVSSGTIFGIVWSVVEADVQSAFAISAYWVSICCLVLGYLGVYVA